MTAALSLGCLASLGLDELAAVAELHQRHDAKFLLGRDDLSELVDVLAKRVQVLEVGGKREIPYRTVYFDTPELTTYRWHVQRRRRRYKVRTRHYGDPAGTMLELKLKGPRGLTVKHRWPHTGPDPEVLDEPGRALVAAALSDAYGADILDDLGPTARTTFERVTLVDPAAGERMTIDRGLTVELCGRTVTFDTDLAIVECKTGALHAPILRTMAELGHRPVNVSKYGLGVAASRHPDTPRGNVWVPALRRLVPTG